VTIAWSNRLRQLILALVTIEFLFALGAAAGWYRAVRDSDSARAEVADLKAKLAEQATDQTSCLKDNINLITWKVNAQLMLMEAADDLSFCAAHVPGRKFPRRRKLDLDDSFVGAEVFPPQ
jgi:hypothetical protein